MIDTPFSPTLKPEEPLNIYRYSAPTRSKILDLVESIRDRVWIPHQFAEEFIRNRASVIYEQAQSYREALRDLKSLVDQRLKVPHKHPFVSTRSVKALEDVCGQLIKSEQIILPLLTEDPFVDRLSRALEGRIGPPPSEADMTAIRDEAKRRYAAKIPPGYLDSKKAADDAYGDFTGWRQILTYGAEIAKSGILVTDDTKEDWWYGQAERRLGPRPELVSEYLRTCQKPFYMYTLVQFLKFSQSRLGQRIGVTVMNEVRAQSQATLTGEGVIVKAPAPYTPPFPETPKEVAPTSADKDSPKQNSADVSPEKPILGS